MIEFPKGFFWGAATSAYQVEGDNVNSDWWKWEKEAGLRETSGRACRHYQLYKEDFYLAKFLHHTAHRLSIEWSRIEPRQREFSFPQIEHYKDVISALREFGLEPVVSLHHFTNPLWFARSGGWERKDASRHFLRYTEEIVEALCGNVRYWITINEPLVFVCQSYIMGKWPPQEKSFLKALRVERNLADAHIKAYSLIHSIYKRKNLSAPYVSVAQNMQAFVSCDGSLTNKISGFLRDKFYNFSFLEKLIRHKTLDYIGVNYYTRGLVHVRGWGLANLLLDSCNADHHPLKKNCLGWDIYPEGLYQLLIRLKKYNLPVFITENGICTENDAERWEFIRDHLKYIALAITQGVHVIGYIYWSLIDNFEWDKGFGPRFGIIAMDYATSTRTVRESAKKFSSVCKTGVLHID